MPRERPTSRARPPRSRAQAWTAPAGPADARAIAHGRPGFEVALTILAIAVATPKETAIERVAQALGLTGINPWGGPYDDLFHQARRAGLPTNPDVSFTAGVDLPGGRWQRGPSSPARPFAPAVRLGSRRTSGGVEYGGGTEHAPPADLLELRDGLSLRLAGAPVVIAGDGVSVARDVSSPYAPLLQVYDIDVAGRIAEARSVAGTAFVLMSDIGDGNYCHWLVDELPRLALIADRPDVTIVIAAVDAPWRRELLDLLGIAPERIVALGPHEALRADVLLVPDATRDMWHPARKGADWVLSWLRSRVGLPAMARQPPPEPETRLATRLYIGRSDASRRLLNEAALLRVLEPAGFVSITLGGRSVAEQVALFARAEAIVALHGAALANIVFCEPGTRLVEIFPPDYGTAAFGVLAAAGGLRHATYVADPGRWPDDGSHDCMLDVPEFWRAVGPWLRGDCT